MKDMWVAEGQKDKVVTGQLLWVVVFPVTKNIQSPVAAEIMF